MKIDEVVDLILNSKSKSIGHFNANSGPNKDRKIGYNYVDEEVIHICENNGGMRGYSFESCDNYEDGKLISHRDLEDKEEIRSIISSFTFSGSVNIYMVNGEERKKIGTVYNENKRKNK